MKVYLAGKIAKNDWRHQIFSDLDRAEFHHEKGKIQTQLITDGFHYNGPFFLSCDHGCYHGDGNHGRGVYYEGCGEDGDSQSTTLKKCLNWIQNSDAIFVWLDAKDAYGTISEIGYANSLKKPIFLAIDKKFEKTYFAKDTWFVQSMCNQVVFSSSFKEAWKEFVKIYKNEENEPFSYIYNKENLKWIRTKISEYCNRLASKHSEKELNSLNRLQLAKNFKDSNYLQYRFEDLLEDKIFIEDIAKEIDFRMVRGYLKNKTQKPDKYLQTWSISETNLIYAFKENYKREQELKNKQSSYIPKATPKQIDFLYSLLEQNGYTVIIPLKDLSFNQANSIIGFFYEKKEISEEINSLLQEKEKTYKANEIVKLINKKLFYSKKEKFGIGLHTKCLHYFEEKGFIILYEDNEYIKYIKLRDNNDPAYIVRLYKEDWISLLIDTLSNKEKYEEIKKFKKKNKQ